MQHREQRKRTLLKRVNFDLCKSFKFGIPKEESWIRPRLCYSKFLLKKLCNLLKNCHQPLEVLTG